MRLFDTHAHLLDERFDLDREALIADLAPNDVVHVLEAATCCDDIGRVAALCAGHPAIYGAVGVHPEAALGWNSAMLRDVKRGAKEQKIVAIGEIGLDYHYEDACPRETQKRAFSEQVALSVELGLPVLVHDREAHGDCLDVLRANRNGLTGVMHCFSGSYEFARQCIDLGLYIAFGGALTFKNAVKQRDIAARLPLDRLLIETDCPYMTPEPYRGQRNDPRKVKNVLLLLASVRQKDPEAVAEATFANACKLFSINA